jgi:hypothetical protein
MIYYINKLLQLQDAVVCNYQHSLTSLPIFPLGIGVVTILEGCSAMSWGSVVIGNVELMILCVQDMNITKGSSDTLEKETVKILLQNYLTPPPLCFLSSSRLV